MDALRWRQIDELFHEAVACGTPRRAALLSEKCGSDSGMRVEVESLLAAHDEASSILEWPLIKPHSRANTCAAPVMPRDGSIGSYRLLRLIGTGGMGVVYEAEQSNPHRNVALKIMRSLPGGDEFTSRIFRREGQALARLQHPGIAAIYEAGKTDDGWNYFAMELVDGRPLTQYANEKNLTLEQRLQLFVQICETVQYAHQRGVIHRDLKPSNILVTDAGQPKILDFGLARIIEPGADVTRITQGPAFQGTPAYTSPEQTRGRPDEVDVRSDVYSLGVILYELITKALPYELSGLTLSQAAQRICEQRPRPAGSIDRSLRGELETILSKALEKEPDQRYVSAAALGDDVQRYLGHLPILAHPPSAAYQIRKLVARYKLPFSIASAALAFIITLIMWLSILYLRTRDAEKLAREKAATANRVKAFMLDIFTSQDPDQTKGENISAAELLDRGVQRVEQQLRDEPLVEAEVLSAIGGVRLSRGEYSKAADVYEKSLAIRRERLGERDSTTAMTHAELGNAYRGLSRFSDAEKQLNVAIETLENTVGPQDVSVAKVEMDLGEVIRSHDAKLAESHYRRALEIRRNALGESHPDVAEALTNVGVSLRGQGRNAEAEACYREALPILVKNYGEDRVAVGDTYNSLGVALKYQNRLAEAEECYLHALRIYKKIWNGSHPRIANSLRSLGQLQRAEGRYGAAKQTFLESIAMSRKLMGSVDFDLATTLFLLGAVLDGDLGDAEGAIAPKREGLAIYRQLLPHDHSSIAYGCRELALTLYDAGQYDEAVKLMRETVKIGETVPNPDPKAPRIEALDLGRLLIPVGALDESEPLLRRAKEMCEAAKDDWRLSDADRELGRCLALKGQRDEAEQLLLSSNTLIEKGLEEKNLPSPILNGWLISQHRTLSALVEFYGSGSQSEVASSWRSKADAAAATLRGFREVGLARDRE